MSFRFDASELISNLASQEMKTKAALGLYSDSVAKQMEAHAKSNRSWQDRTGQARNSLKGSWKWRGQVARVELSHGVDYGIWLEFANERRYAIVKPTVDAISPKAIKGLDKILFR